VLRASKGERGIVQPCFAYIAGIPGGESLRKTLRGLEYFSANVEFGVTRL
jgi:malate dehydrogenase